jgi:hypothetical protein
MSKRSWGNPEIKKADHSQCRGMSMLVAEKRREEQLEMKNWEAIVDDGHEFSQRPIITPCSNCSVCPALRKSNHSAISSCILLLTLGTETDA